MRILSWEIGNLWSLIVRPHLPLALEGDAFSTSQGGELEEVFEKVIWNSATVSKVCKTRGVRGDSSPYSGPVKYPDLCISGREESHDAVT